MALPAGVSLTFTLRRSLVEFVRRTRPAASALSSRLVMVPDVSSMDLYSAVGVISNGGPLRRSAMMISATSQGSPRAAWRFSEGFRMWLARRSMRPTMLGTRGPRSGRSTLHCCITWATESCRGPGSAAPGLALLMAGQTNV